MLRKRGSVGLVTLILTLSLALGAIPLQAVAACKGLGSSACKKNSNCSWVKDYVRKDGVKVAGHCKSKPTSSGGSGNKKKSDSTKKPSDKGKSGSTKKSGDKGKSDSTKKSGDKSKSDGKK